MVNYPKLSAQQQQDLPRLIQADAIAKSFEDSTHQLWQCNTTDGMMMLKVCDETSVKQSSFWQGMTLLFDVDLPAQLGKFQAVHTQLAVLSPLQIPDYIASNSRDNNITPAFILTEWLTGGTVDPAKVNDKMVVTLAQHISQLHCHQHHCAGAMHSAKISTSQWSEKLQNTLKQLAKQQNIPKDIINKAITLTAQYTPDYYVPVMIDLRWDQFLQQQGRLTALVDLDALVYAPRELDLVLLEYILNKRQAEIFSQHYQHKLPDLMIVRYIYRLILFMMNILGEKDLDSWLSSPTRF